MKAVLSERGQVTVPKPLRGRLVGTKQPREDPIEKVHGVLRMGRGTDAIMRRLRGRADAT